MVKNIFRFLAQLSNGEWLESSIIKIRKRSGNAKIYMKAFGTCLKVLKATIKKNESIGTSLTILK